MYFVLTVFADVENSLQLKFLVREKVVDVTFL